MVKNDVELYPFYNANIHERRFAARFARAVPLLCILGIMATVLYGCLRSELLLLSLCAVMNVTLWLWITTTALLAVAGSFMVVNELKKRDLVRLPRDKDKSPFSTPRPDSPTDVDSDGVVHLIVLPNYKEDVGMLAETLSSLNEAEDSHNFLVVLAMEAREGQAATEKTTQLQEKFATAFAALTVTMHPTDLKQEHLDGSVDLEVPGKASNLKYAVNQAHDILKKQDENRLPNVVLTVADADCMFHPDYFASITKDFNALREKPGAEHQWSMWQAPQLSFRDHWHAPICSRIWTYVSSFYEFGGVSGLYWGGHHMVFSGYSLPLQLAVSAQSWDGDVIAEDHHSYIKNFFYSAHASAAKSLSQPCAAFNDGCQPMLKVRPIFLPVKSLPVISNEGYWHTFVERWHQAKRHAQGVAELPYALLVVWDAFCTLPMSAYSLSLFYQTGRIVMRLLCMHILPVCQAIGLATMTLYWLYFNRHLQSCPSSMRLVEALQSEYPLCAFGGAWNLVWPMAIPFGCVILANYMMVSTSFLMPVRHNRGKSAWHDEDSGIEPMCGSKNFSAFVLISVDCVVFMSFMMIPYGLIACLLATWNVCFSGNRFKYITAAKAVKTIKDQENSEKSGYGTISEPKQCGP